MSSKQKKITATATAVILVLALGLAGTFAASSGDSSDGGFGEEVDTSLSLHDDFSTSWTDDVRDRDIYVENTGDTSLYVRIRLDEFMRYGSKSIISGGKEKDLDTWTPHKATGSDVTECSTEIHDYFTLQMGNDAGVKYKSGVKNSYNPAITEADKTETTSAAKVVTIDEYLNATDKPDPCWILDDDGYAYWHTQLKKTQATGLILNSITNTGLVDESYYYGINAVAQAVTETDLNAWFSGNPPTGKTEAVDRASKKAVRLLKNLSPKYVEITDDMNVGTKATEYDSDNDGYLTKQEYQEYLNEANASNTLNTVNFPDKAFKDFLSANVDSDKNNILSADEIAAATSLNLSGKGISDLSGIEKLTALTDLNVSGNNLTKLDLSKNTALTTVDASNQTPTVTVMRNESTGKYKSEADLFLAGTTFGDTSNVSLESTDNSVTLSSYVKTTTFKTPISYGKAKTSGSISGTIAFRTEIQKAVKDTAVGKTVSIKNSASTYGTKTDWIVLSKDENEAILIAKNQVTARSFHSKTPYPTWEASDIKTWLNGTYYATLDVDMQMALKAETLRTARAYNDWSEENMTTSNDNKVYLLTETAENSEEVAKNPGDTPLMTSAQLKCALETADGTADSAAGSVAGQSRHWWLRSPRTSSVELDCRAAVVRSTDGAVHTFGYFVPNTYGIRPAVTISLK